jgi:hypothetical protein
MLVEESKIVVRSGDSRCAVVEVDDAVGEGFGGEELEADGAVAGLDEGDAFANEDGDDVDAELVDFALVQQGGDDFAAAHHPDVFAGLGAQALGEGFDGLVDEFEGWQWGFARAAGKDVVLDFRTEAEGLHVLPHAHFEAFGVGLVAPEDGIDGFEEGGHAVIALGAGTVEPGDVAIGASDEAVGAGGDVDDDFSGVFHGASPRWVLGNDNATGTGGHLFGFL